MSTVAPIRTTSGLSSQAVRAVMLTQFDDIEGYMVAVSDPKNVMTDQFKDIGYHFLPDKGICWRLITMGLGDYKMIGVPVHIEDSKYARRAFVFCLCLVVENAEPAIRLGKLAAQELADTLYSLEIESSFLSTSENWPYIQTFLTELREILNGEIPYVKLELGGSNIEFIKPVAPALTESATESIHPFSTPVVIVDIDSHLSPEQKAQNQQLIDVLYICDGSRSVAEISVYLSADFTELVRLLSLLAERGLVVIIDQPIDQFSRVRLTPSFHSFFDDLRNRQEAVSYSLISDHDVQPRAVSATDPGGGITNLGDYLVRMYCRLDGHVQDLGEFDSSHNSVGNISSRHMIIYGLVKGFLRCKTMYPVCSDHATTMVPVLRSCDGRLSWDDIGFKHGLTRAELNEVFTHHNVLRIWC